MAEFEPGEAITTVIKRRRYTGAVISIQGDLITVALQQPYRGADQQMHVSTWRQRLSACKLSKVS